MLGTLFGHCWSPHLNLVLSAQTADGSIGCFPFRSNFHVFYSFLFCSPLNSLRSFMMSENMTVGPEALLSRALLAVLDALPHSAPSTLRSTYREVIQLQAEALDAMPMPATGALPNYRASMTCKAGLILFGEGVKTPDGDGYEKQQQGNW